MSYNIELETRRAIRKLDEKNKTKTDEETILSILYPESIYNWINVDIIDHVSSFMKPYEILSLVLLSKTLIKFLPDVWIIIHNNTRPKSILPREDYMLLKNQMMISSWYYNMYIENTAEDFSKFIEIDTNEEYIYKRNLENKYLKAGLKRYFNTIEIKSYKKRNAELIKDLKFNIEPFKKFKIYEIPSLMVFKGSIDMGLYGLDKNNPIDYKRWFNTGIKWSKYILNDYEIEWELFTGHFDKHDPDWEYDYSKVNAIYSEDNDRDSLIYSELESFSFKYRYRKIPDWLNFN